MYLIHRYRKVIQMYARTYTGLGKQTLGGHKQNPVCTRTQEKGAVTHRRLAQIGL